ncbi:MAG: DNA repair protein RecO [Cyanobacteria bacterium P01_D01_bin.115]
MSRSYKATGINLKGMPMGETDRLVTILTVEQGLVRVIVPGARKHKSRLGGRSSQFVVNELFIVQGKNLDKLVQAETIRSFPSLSADLARLTASQYLAELVLCQALSEQPQEELFGLLVAQLQQLEQAQGNDILAALTQGIVQLLIAAGVAPDLDRCSVSQIDIAPDPTQPDWQVGFSAVSGGLVSLEQMAQLPRASPRARMPVGRYARSNWRVGQGRSPRHAPPTLITAQELSLLQQLSYSTVEAQMPLLPAVEGVAARVTWLKLERLLRQYAEYHFDRPIRSASLIDACFPVAAP